MVATRGFDYFFIHPHEYYITVYTGLHYERGEGGENELD